MHFVASNCLAANAKLGSANAKMRINQTVTQREFEISDGATLMSTTNLQSHIAYANAAFIAASGFDAEELYGEPHNIVRHPDMPKEAYADMWRTLKGGEPWTAVVKNRRKDGDHYWVRANVSPIVRNGQHLGYVSVRTKPTREEVKAAEAFYADLQLGKAGYTLFKGLKLRKGLLGRWGYLPVRWRLRLPIMTVVAAGLLGIGMMSYSISPAMAAAAVALAAIAALWAIEQQVVKPIEHLAEHARRVAAGESGQMLHMNRVDEIGMAARSINQVGLMFRWIIDDVSHQVLTVQSASTEIAQGNDDLSARTEQSAASVEQSAAAMEQMNHSVKNNAEAAQQASEWAASACRAAGDSGASVKRVLATMGSITEASKRIADITGLIDSLAFQTNILALNAAVEAARAGEQGRGFAVVAGEVRNLAQRSAQAAKEIRSLIQDSVDRIARGGSEADEAGRMIADAVSQVQRVADLIAEISQATLEQSRGVSEVTSGVSQLDQTTQRNAALVEQSAAAAQSLAYQTTQLVSAVSVFRS